MTRQRSSIAAVAGIIAMIMATITPWAGLFGPANLPREVVDRVAAAMNVVSARQDVRTSLDRIAFELQSSTPEEMAALLKDQLEVWRRTVQDVGFERN